MKIADLLMAREATQKASAVELDGERALKLRRLLKQINEEMSHVDDAREQYIKTHAADGKSIKSEEAEAYAGAIKLMSEMAEQEANVEIEPILQYTDFDQISAAHVESLISIGLMEDPG